MTTIQGGMSAINQQKEHTLTITNAIILTINHNLLMYKNNIGFEYS